MFAAYWAALPTSRTAVVTATHAHINWQYAARLHSRSPKPLPVRAASAAMRQIHTAAPRRALREVGITSPASRKGLAPRSRTRQAGDGLPRCAIGAAVRCIRRRCETHRPRVNAPRTRTASDTAFELSWHLSNSRCQARAGISRSSSVSIRDAPASAPRNLPADRASYCLWAI